MSRQAGGVEGGGSIRIQCRVLEVRVWIRVVKECTHIASYGPYILPAKTSKRRLPHPTEAVSWCHAAIVCAVGEVAGDQAEVKFLCKMLATCQNPPI